MPKRKRCETQEELCEDLWSYIIRFLTHYQNWNTLEDNKIYQNLVSLSKSWHKRIRENQCYFVFRINSLVPFVRKKIDCNALSTICDLDENSKIILRNRSIVKWRRRVFEDQIFRNLSLLSPCLEHLHLRNFRSCNLQMLTQVKSLSLQLHMDSNRLL